MRRIIALLAALAAPGCAFTEPYAREGTWRPTGAVEANIVAQLAKPSDYLSGTPYAPVSTAPLSAAVARWKSDQVRPLPNNVISKVGGGGGAANGGSAAPAPTGGTGAAVGGS